MDGAPAFMRMATLTQQGMLLFTVNTIEEKCAVVLLCGIDGQQGMGIAGINGNKSQLFREAASLLVLHLPSPYMAALDTCCHSSLYLFSYSVITYAVEWRECTVRCRRG